jgi:hypothetical protein
LRGLSEANRPMRTSQHLWRRLNGDYVHRRRTAVDYNESTQCRRLARAMERKYRSRANPHPSKG